MLNVSWLDASGSLFIRPRCVNSHNASMHKTFPVILLCFSCGLMSCSLISVHKHINVASDTLDSKCWVRIKRCIYELNLLFPLQLPSECLIFNKKCLIMKGTMYTMKCTMYTAD